MWLLSEDGKNLVNLDNIAHLEVFASQGNQRWELVAWFPVAWVDDPSHREFVILAHDLKREPIQTRFDLIKNQLEVLPL